METKIRVGAVIIKDKKVLLLKGKGYDELWTPGGKIEGNESDEECLRRELKEEIDVNLISMKFFKEYLRKSPYHDHMTQSRLYFVEIVGELTPRREIEKFVWYTQKDFYDKRYPMIPVNEEEVIPDIIKQKLLVDI